MNLIQRRTLLGALSATALAATSAAAWGQAAAPAQTSSAAKSKNTIKLSPRLRIVIPANVGGGWDQTGRALGAALVAAGVVDELEYENKGGKGGTLGLAYYNDKYSADPNTLLIGGSVMVGAVALQKPVVDLSAITPVARLTSDYLVIVVAANSPIRTATDLSARMRTGLKAMPVAGGSAGGVDHLFAGVFARAVGAKPEELDYLPFAGGAEVVQAVLSGKAAIGISGYSEFSAQLASGQLRAVGVSSRRSSFGIPAIREQGFQVEMSNWRGVFTGKGVAAARVSAMADAVQTASLHETWKATLKQNHWDAAWLAGNNFSELIDLDLTTARVMAHLLKLKV